MVRVKVCSYNGRAFFSEMVEGITLEQICELNKQLIAHSPGRSWYNDMEAYKTETVKLGGFVLDIMPGESLIIECCGQ